MSNANDRDKVVDLGSHPQLRAGQPGRLLASVAEVTTRQLHELCDRMFERVDDALFDLAEKAESNAIQTEYFDGMREARKNRAATERRFLEQIRRDLTQFPTRQSAASRQGNGPAPGGAAGAGELSLVNDTELEESLAISSMASKAQSRLSGALYAVNQRLSVICGGSGIDNANNPIGPAALCAAFRQALHGLNAEMRVRLIIYKLFDRYVMAGLEALYAQVNAKLAKAGVLPALRHTVPGKRHYQGASSRPYRQPRGAPPGATAPPDDEADFQADFYQALNNLLAARHGAPEGSAATAAVGAYPPAADAPLLSPAELLGALSLLQGEVAGDGARGETPAAYPAAASGEADIEQLKTHLLRQIHHLRGNPRARMSGADEDTIDLVGMLFEFILEDRNLPTEIQVLLARLQIPYLKVAILDRRMFAHATHPARRLLNALAEAGKSWSAESDRDRRLYKKIHTIVETLLQEFDDDLDLFIRLEEDLTGFLATNHKRAELSEQRVAEATRGREKLQSARRRAAKEVLARIDGKELPDIVHSVLTRAWANYLVLTLLRQGEDADEFRSALRFIDDFVWSALPKQGEQDNRRLRGLLPRLEKALRHGLATVAFQDQDVEVLMGRLNVLYRTQLGEEVPAAIRARATTAVMPEAVEVIARPEIAAQPSTAEPAAASADSSADDAPDLAPVRALKVGTWLEFSHGTNNGDAGPERAKLSWISPISGKYLFVNRRGLKVADRTPRQLADEFATGSVLVLEELPLFDRALDAIVDRLRKTQAERQQAKPDHGPAPGGPALPSS